MITLDNINFDGAKIANLLIILVKVEILYSTFFCSHKPWETKSALRFKSKKHACDHKYTQYITLDV